MVVTSSKVIVPNKKKRSTKIDNSTVRPGVIENPESTGSGLQRAPKHLIEAY